MILTGFIQSWFALRVRCLDHIWLNTSMGDSMISTHAKKYRQVVTPVFTLAITDVENLLGYIQSFHLSDILESYDSTNKVMFTSLSSSVVALLKKARPQRNIVWESFEK